MVPPWQDWDYFFSSYKFLWVSEKTKVTLLIGFLSFKASGAKLMQFGNVFTFLFGKSRIEINRNMQQSQSDRFLS